MQAQSIISWMSGIESATVEGQIAKVTAGTAIRRKTASAIRRSAMIAADGCRSSIRRSMDEEVVRLVSIAWSSFIARWRSGDPSWLLTAGLNGECRASHVIMS